MKILGTRTIAWLYPHLSFEAMVWDEEKEKVYFVNMDVNNDRRMEETPDDSWWAYSIPLDSPVYDLDMYSIHDVDFSDILKKMTKRWNDDPVFTGDLDWKN